MIRFRLVADGLKKTFSDVHFLIVLAVAVGIFILKYNHLSLPYFSDELWGYGPAVRKAVASGPSLLPSSLSLHDHWGHPLMFFFISGLWGTIFGATLFSTHLFAALLSITLLLVMYFVLKDFFDKKIALYSTLIFASQSIFLGQFNLVLPEVLLTIFFFLTLYFSEKRQYTWYVFCASCMVLTKESGVFPIVAIVFWNMYKDLFLAEEKPLIKKMLFKYAMLSLPILALVMHFILLKIQYGWFIMPVRVAEFEFSWDVYQERLMRTIHYVFIDQGRKTLTIALFFVGILFYNKYSWLKRILVLVISFAAMKVFFRYWKMPEVIEFTLVPIVVVYLLKTFFWDNYKHDKKGGGIVAIFSILVFIYILFISSFFDSRRYLFFLIPIVVFTSVYFVSKAPKWSKYILPVFTVLAISSSLYFQKNDIYAGDDTPHYVNLCEIQKEAVAYLEENYHYNQEIQTSFLFKHSLERPLSGYLSTNSSYKRVEGFNNGIVSTEGAVLVFVSSDLPVSYDEWRQKKNRILVKEFKQRNVWIKIYQN